MVKIIFTASPKLLARIIRKLTKSDVSHVMLEYVSDTWKGPMITEATFPTVRIVPAERARHHVVAEYVCKFDTEGGFEAIKPYLGNWYDFKGLLLFGWAIFLFRVLKRKIRHPLTATNSQICSELLTWFLTGSRLPSTDKWDPELTNPLRIKNYLKKHPELAEECSNVS